MEKNRVILFGIFLFVTGAVFANDDLYREYQPDETSRVREAIEWSTTYTFDTLDESKPRLLLIGDSIVNGYNGAVKQRLEGKMNITFWASSKCVTDKFYFRELDLILSANHYDVITFNNGLHSLDTNRVEWETAYRNAVKFLRVKCPTTKLYLVTSTPLKDSALSAKAQELNEIVKKIAVEEELQVIDLYTLLDPLDREEYWSDTFHFKGEGIEKQAEKIVEAVLAP